MKRATSPRRVSVGIRELRNQLSAYVERAKAGDVITVTERGTPVAVLRPLLPEEERLQRLVDEGLVDLPADGGASLPQPRVALTGDGPTLDEIIADQRR